MSNSLFKKMFTILDQLRGIDVVHREIWNRHTGQVPGLQSAATKQPWRVPDGSAGLSAH